jgi:sugar lactone lactonase YvrE
MISNKRVFADTSNVPGIPDGATVDSEGCLWSARFDGARVIRYAPDGKVISEIMLPVSRVTSCTFGGDDLKTLYITSALFRLSDAQRALEPMAGCLFATKVSVAGLLDTKFEG